MTETGYRFPPTAPRSSSARAGRGESAPLWRAVSRRSGSRSGFAARNIDKTATFVVASQGNRLCGRCARSPARWAALFDDANRQLGGIDVVIYNAGARAQGTSPRKLDPAGRCGRLGG